MTDVSRDALIALRYGSAEGFALGILKTRKIAGSGVGVAGVVPWVNEIKTPGDIGARSGTAVGK